MCPTESYNNGPPPLGTYPRVTAYREAAQTPLQPSIGRTTAPKNSRDKRERSSIARIPRMESRHLDGGRPRWNGEGATDCARQGGGVSSPSATWPVTLLTSIRRSQQDRASRVMPIMHPGTDPCLTRSCSLSMRLFLGAEDGYEERAGRKFGREGNDDIGAVTVGDATGHDGSSVEVANKGCRLVGVVRHHYGRI